VTESLAPRDVPIGQYGVSVNDVLLLVTDVPVPDAPDPEAPPGTAPLTVDTVKRFIELISDETAGRFYDASRINDPVRSQAIASTIKLAVINGAAAYVEQAAHPALDGVNSTSSAQVLWSRYASIADQLQVRVAGWIEIGGDIDPEPGTGGDGGSIVFAFQYPIVGDGLRW
jgi:hypothetical protein